MQGNELNPRLVVLTLQQAFKGKLRVKETNHAIKVNTSSIKADFTKFCWENGFKCNQITKHGFLIPV